ncbi:uncharacterized protein LOC141627643 [Silene latifolia]|uniref:uncharacterized protein LOC141627643 n=1 Tax=Silene latifolia TaxID=37657 RepID=UPI003D788520
MSISNSMFEGKKTAVGIKQNKDKYLGVIGSETLVRPMKGRVITNNVNEAPVQKMAASLKLKGHKNSNVHDLGKSAPTLEERAKFQKRVGASAKTRTCYSSKIGGGGAVAGSTRLQAVKSKVPISDKVKNCSRLGVPAGTGKVGRVHLSRISYGNCNIPVVRTIYQKRPTKLSESKGSVESVGSKAKAWLEVSYMGACSIAGVFAFMKNPHVLAEDEGGFLMSFPCQSSECYEYVR